MDTLARRDGPAGRAGREFYLRTARRKVAISNLLIGSGVTESAAKSESVGARRTRPALASAGPARSRGPSTKVTASRDSGRARHAATPRSWRPRARSVRGPHPFSASTKTLRRSAPNCDLGALSPRQCVQIHGGSPKKYRDRLFATRNTRNLFTARERHAHRVDRRVRFRELVEYFRFVYGRNLDRDATKRGSAFERLNDLELRHGRELRKYRSFDLRLVVRRQLRVLLERGLPIDLRPPWGSAVDFCD